MVQHRLGRVGEVAARASSGAHGRPFTPFEGSGQTGVAPQLGPEVVAGRGGDVVRRESARRRPADHHAERGERRRARHGVAERERPGHGPEVTGRRDDDHGAARGGREPCRVAEGVSPEIDDDDLVRSGQRADHVGGRVADQPLRPVAVGAEHARPVPRRQERGELVPADLAPRGVEVRPAQARLVLDAEEHVDPAAGEVAVDEDGLLATGRGAPGDRGGEDRGTGPPARTDDADDCRVAHFSEVSGHGARVHSTSGDSHRTDTRLCGSDGALALWMTTSVESVRQTGGRPDERGAFVTWIEHALLWHVYPLGFLGAEPAATHDGVQHRLAGLEPWLDHAVSLGASGVLLGPVFASATHGYDTIDHFRVDERLGDEHDLVALFEAAHARGLRVVLDGVFNHVGQGFERFRTALAEGPDSRAAAWFRLRWPADGGPPEHDDFEGHSALVALDHENPEVTEHVASVMEHWLDRGADGWRLDAAYAVPPAFWAPVLARVRAAHPDVYVVGEVIHGDYAGIVRESGMDAVTQYELWKAVWSSLNDANAHELAHALGRHAAFCEDFVPLTFVGNHDVTRIASRLDDPRHLPHALAVLLTVAGTPCVYAGDELGFEGIKEDRAGGDDAIRPAFPADPATLDAGGSAVFRLHQELIGLRRRHAWLHTARTEVVSVTSTLLVYTSTDRSGPGTLVVALSTSDDPATVALPGRGAVLAGDGSAADAGSAVRLPPHGWAVVALETPLS